jgi:hypothetical protein
MKHLVGNMPVPIWSGTGRSRAERILALVEEAGGVASIVEIASAAPAKSSEKGPSNKLTCNWCGFPLKEGDTHCGFCMTAVGDAAGKSEPHRKAKAKAKGIAPKRLLCYAIILIVEILVAIIIR